MVSPAASPAVEEVASPEAEEVASPAVAAGTASSVFVVGLSNHNIYAI